MSGPGKDDNWGDSSWRFPQSGAPEIRARRAGWMEQAVYMLQAPVTPYRQRNSTLLETWLMHTKQLRVYTSLEFVLTDVRCDGSLKFRWLREQRQSRLRARTWMIRRFEAAKFVSSSLPLPPCIAVWDSEFRETLCALDCMPFKGDRWFCISTMSILLGYKKGDPASALLLLQTLNLHTRS